MIYKLQIFVLVLMFSSSGLFAQNKAEINMSYEGFTTEAQEAFQYAVDIWESLLISDVPINIHAEWTELPANQGGHCVAGSYLQSFDGALYDSTLYPIALAEKLARKELNGSGEPDIIATFNSSEPNWYFGLDKNLPEGKKDFVTVVLHEIAHGLGIFGSFTVDGSNGTWGDGTNLPSIFDRMVINSAEQNLIDTTLFAMNSASLYTQLTGEDLFFKSEQAKAILGNYPKLFAPTTFYDGSSIYHLDEDTYPQGDVNSLMTPVFNEDVIHHPGDVALAMLADMGWINTYIEHTPLPDSEELSKPFSVVAKLFNDMDMVEGSVLLHYSYNDFQNEEIVQMQATGNENEYSADIPGLATPVTISYYISVMDVTNITYTSPSRAPIFKHSFFIGSDDEKPDIQHEALSSLSPEGALAELTAQVYDNSGVESVVVEYMINDGEVINVGMSTTDNYNFNVQLDLSGLVDEGDVFKYKIKAMDISTNQNTAYFPEEGFVEVFVSSAKSEYSTNFDDEVNDFIGTYFSVTTPDGFENGALHSKHPYEGTGKDGELANYTAQLKFPILVNAENPRMSFDEIVLVEPGDAGVAFGRNEFWDYVIVEASKDNGESWFRLLDGYDCNSDTKWKQRYNSSMQTSGRNHNSTAKGTSELFKTRTISFIGPNTDIEAGNIILIRFRLFSDPFSVGWGWAIDNLQIQTSGVGIDSPEKQQSIVYPNPVGDVLTFKRQEGNRLQSLCVYNIKGQKIYTCEKTKLNELVRIETQQFAKGLYVLKATYSDKVDFVKFIKK